MAMRFVDSLAAVFNAPKPPAITYYLARSPEEAFSLNGIDFYLPGSRTYAGVANYQVFSGVPKLGEFYAHELTHMVLGWVLPSLGAPQVLHEALPLWIGGGREMTWPELKRELATELRCDSTMNPPRERGTPDLVAGAAKALNMRRSDVEAVWRKSVLDAR